MWPITFYHYHCCKRTFSVFGANLCRATYHKSERHHLCIVALGMLFMRSLKIFLFRCSYLDPPYVCDTPLTWFQKQCTQAGRRRGSPLLCTVAQLWTDRHRRAPSRIIETQCLTIRVAYSWADCYFCFVVLRYNVLCMIWRTDDTERRRPFGSGDR